MTPTNPDDARYTLTELADLAGVTPRTVRYYLAQGLLPGVGVAGPGAKYDDTHLARLRLIRRRISASGWCSASRLVRNGVAASRKVDASG